MPAPIRVLYNASAVPERPAGAGVYTLQLGRALASRDDLELVVWSTRDLAFGTRRPHPAGRGKRLARETLGVGPSVRDSDVDVYHGPHMFTPRARLPTIATVHDLTFFRIPARYDLPHRAYYRFLAHTARRASRIIVPSGAVAADVIRYLGYAPARIRVIPEAPRDGLAPATEEAQRAWRTANGIEGPFLLCLGTAEPGKRAVDAVRAMPSILAAVPRASLVLAGHAGRLSEPLRREAGRLGVRDNVRFLGYVADTDLSTILTSATALVFPSLYEGFGLPPLEAMACGTPVIASRAPAMDTVLAGAAACVPLRDPAAIAAEAIRCLTDEPYREHLARSGRNLAGQFSWQSTAAQTVGVYREVVT